MRLSDGVRLLYVNDDLDFDATVARATDLLAKEAPLEEEAAIRQWIDTSSEHGLISRTLERAWQCVPPRRAPEVEHRIMAEVMRAVAPAQSKRFRLGGPRRAVAAFATTAVVATVLFVVGLVRLGDDQRQTSAAPLSQEGWQDHSEYRIYTTAPGQRATVDLGDGTQVTLNVASRLEVPRGFGVTHRSVRLIGQALFEVTQTEALPFVVNAAGTQTRVLGTTFGIRAYDADVQVAVKSGKVSVLPCEGGIDHADQCPSDARATVVTPTEVLVVMPSGSMRLNDGASVDNAIAFANGRLLLNGAPLRTMIDDLNRWYDVTIQLTDSTLGEQPLKGELLPGTWEDLARMLELTVKAKTEQRGKVLRVFR